MKFLTRLVILLLCLLMLVFSASCGKSEDKTDTSSESPAVSGNYDYDFTKMGQSVAYSQLSDFMNEPAKYLGKTMKITGDYYAQPSDDGSTTYYYIILNDTTACCSAYIEFLTNGCDYPEKSSDPENNDIVTVTATGVVDSYVELGKTYYILKADSIA